MSNNNKKTTVKKNRKKVTKPKSIFVVAEGKSAELDEYVKREEIASMRLESWSRSNPRKKRYAYTKNNINHTARGLTKYLKQRYVLNYKEPRRRYSKKSNKPNNNESNGKHDDKFKFKSECSSRGLGKRVDRELAVHIKKTFCKFKSRSKKPQHPLTIAILELWQRMSLTPIASQVPVHICDGAMGSVCTQIDILLLDAQNKLWMHEIKTGGIRVNTEKGSFAHPFDNVKCTKRAQWDLQRHYCHKSLINHIPLVGSKVIHAYTVAGVAHAIPLDNIF